MKGEDSQSSLESLIAERQRFGYRPYRRSGPLSPLSDHSKRQFDCNYLAVCGLIVARACAHVYDASSITQGRNDQPLDSWVWSAGCRITVADALVQLMVGT